MPALRALLAAHPIRKKPYNAIKFARIDGNGVLLYRVVKQPREIGAGLALKTAFELLGGHCFHCKRWMPPQPLSHDCTRDHVQPRSDGGGDHLHNLVLSCGACNRSKGRRALVAFNAETGSEYMAILGAHLAHCIGFLAEEECASASPKNVGAERTSLIRAGSKETGL